MSTPRAFYLRNLSTSDLHPVELALLPAVSVRPVFSSKSQYCTWCQDSRTQHVFYTLAEPEQPAVRGSGLNPIRRLHGLVADYDGDAPAVQGALARVTFAPGLAPTWVTTTFSGKARLIWAFERPVPAFTPEVLGALIDLLARELALRKLLPGLDEGALKSPFTPYELGTDWREPYGDTRLADALVQSLLQQASARARWRTPGPEIPFAAAAAEVARRWPGRWTGPFEEGMRGIRFWDTKADNPAGCTLRREGVQAWSGEGRFIFWAELLGEGFVRQFRTERVGAAIAGVYFDGASYWQRDGLQVWRRWTAEALRRRLHVTLGLSPEGARGEPSEISRTLTAIENQHHVDAAVPLLFIKDDFVEEGGRRYLNLARAQPVSPGVIDGRPAWGEGFPWIAGYLSGLLGEAQLPVFLGWLAHFYRNAVRGRPKRGQALFLAGPPAAGKTFLSQKLIGGLMGGFQEASSYLLGRTRFNEQLFAAPVWTVDDGEAGADPRRRAAFSEAVKRLVANHYQEYCAKFRAELTLPHHGRIVVTLNTDEASLGLLPDIERSLLDKVSVFRARPGGTDFAAAPGALTGELPHFAAFLAHHEIAPELRRNAAETQRFGLDAYFHPDLLQGLRDNSDETSFRELLEIWRVHYFRVKENETCWSGTATALIVELRNNEVLAKLPPRYADHHFVGVALRQLVRAGLPWLSVKRTKEARLWELTRPEKL